MMEDYEEQEEQARQRRKERLERMRREKQKQQLRRRAMIRLGIPAVLAVVVIVAAVNIFGHGKNSEAKEQQESGSVQAQSMDTESMAAAGRDLEGTTAENAETGIEAGTAAEGTEADKDGAEAASAIAAGMPGDAQTAAANSGDAGTAGGLAAGKVYSAQTNAQTVTFGGDLVSENAILVDVSTGDILARKAENQRVSPASMTKVLTVLVAAEHVSDLDDTFTITTDITDYSYVNDCSNVGFAKDETVTVRDLFYGTILPSGADAAAGLAVYVAGSLDDFVYLMNEKLDELGLSDSAHFTNCVGLYDENHYCTVYDMAMIMEAAMDNELCREVLSAHTYTTSETPEHPEGITISNWFLRRIEDKDAGGEVLCAKTGYVVQSKNCAVSYAKDASGEEYICVTVGATSAWRCIYDHVDIYKQFLG